MNDRIFKYMSAAAMDAMILCRQDNIAYATGYDTPMQYGSIDNFTNGPFSYAILDLHAKKTTLIVVDCHLKNAQESSFADEILSFESFDFFKPVDCMSAAKSCLKKAIAGLKGVRRIGIEELALPAWVYNEIYSLGTEIQSAFPVLWEARKIKQPYEIERLRYAASIVDAGQRYLTKLAANFEGGSEFEIHSSIYQYMCNLHKKPINLTGDFATGPRICCLSGVYGPSFREIQPGDAGILDMSIRINGYFCDCANTVIFGAKPNAEQKYYFQMVRDAFDAGFEKLIPGNRLSDVDAAINKVFEQHGTKPVVYSGHQIGCNVNEPPRIQNFVDDIIEPNMVLCIEPQNYSFSYGNTGVRLERAILITDDGPEALTTFPWGIEP